MKLEIFSIVLDGFPFITWHLPVFNRLTIPWHWTIAEGAAMNHHDTSWCKPQAARLSSDGTTEYLNEIKRHPNVTVIQKTSWDGKREMCNACLSRITVPSILLQLDADELWEPGQLEALLLFFKAYPEINQARFFCRYFVGQNIITTSENAYGNNPGEWLRAWRYYPGQKFSRHEPPVLNGLPEKSATREQTRECGLVFNHYAYAFEKQLTFKEKFYGYTDAVKHWRRLQTNTVWPVKLKDFLPWVDDRATADLLHKS